MTMGQRVQSPAGSGSWWVGLGARFSWVRQVVELGECAIEDVRSGRKGSVLTAYAVSAA